MRKISLWILAIYAIHILVCSQNTPYKLKTSDISDVNEIMFLDKLSENMSGNGISDIKPKDTLVKFSYYYGCVFESHEIMETNSKPSYKSLNTIKNRSQLARCELDNRTHVRYNKYIATLVPANSGGMRTWTILKKIIIKNRLLNCWTKSIIQEL